jgi:type II secretory pathway pseudopilin PulG
MIPAIDSIRMMVSASHAGVVRFVAAMSRIQGLSFIEVVLVVALAMVVAAAVIPRVLGSRVAANEATAISNVDVITYAQQSYRTTYPAIGYAASLSNLALTCHHDCVPSPEHACLIDCNLPGASVTPKDGYIYGLASDSRSPHQTYVVVTSAAVPDYTGKHDFCAIEDGKIRTRPAAGASPSNVTHDQCRSWQVMP